MSSSVASQENREFLILTESCFCLPIGFLLRAFCCFFHSSVQFVAHRRCFRRTDSALKVYCDDANAGLKRSLKLKSKGQQRDHIGGYNLLVCDLSLNASHFLVEAGLEVALMDSRQSPDVSLGRRIHQFLHLQVGLLELYPGRSLNSMQEQID